MAVARASVDFVAGRAEILRSAQNDKRSRRAGGSSLSGFVNIRVNPPSLKLRRASLWLLQRKSLLGVAFGFVFLLFANDSCDGD